MYINRYRENLLEIAALNITISSAKGNKLLLDDGRVVYDFLAQYGALPFGHSPTFACDALKEFIDKQTPNFIQPNVHPKVRELAMLLAQHTNEAHYKHCTFTNSGTETVEAAIKLARIATGRQKILSLNNSFHGKTYSSLSATGSDRFKTHTIHDPVNYEHVDYSDGEEIAHRLSHGEFAAFIIEPVQGEGGMQVIPPELLGQYIDICQKTGTVSISDEIQTGLGRIGAFCMARRYGLLPDIILFSKALGAGFIPVGAMLYSAKLYCNEFDQKHSSTFAGNGIAATMGIAVIQQLTQDNNRALDHVNVLSERIDKHLENIRSRYPDIFTWQGTGLMRGLEFKDESSKTNIINNYFQRSGHLAYLICSYLLNHYQLLTMPLLSRQCSVRFEPPLDVSIEEVDTFFRAITDICQLIRNGRYDILLAQFAGVPCDSLPPADCSFAASTAANIAQITLPHRPVQKGKRFAFLIHNTSLADITHNFCPSIRANYTQAQQDALGEWLVNASTTEYAPEMAYEFSVESDHAHVDGMLIFSPISHLDMMKLSRREKKRLMNDYLDIAKENGAEIVGLGAYTSVITSGGETIVANSQNRILTNGNSLTAFSVLMSIRACCPKTRRH